MGNIIDPQEIIKDEGAEALRFWSAIEGDLTKQDFACSREKIRGEVKTLNKLWNVSKFIFQFKEEKKPGKLFATDKLFVDYVDYLADFCEKNYKKYNFHLPALKLRNFLWETFASHYIELVKNRAYNKEKKFSKTEQKSAVYSLRYILKKILVLLYPIIPMITSEIYSEFGAPKGVHSSTKKKDMREEGNIFKEKFPTGKALKPKFVDAVLRFNSKVWKKKKKQGKSLKDEIEIEIPKELKSYKKDLVAMHNIV